jgi:hypothetical protein
MATSSRIGDPFSSEVGTEAAGAPPGTAVPERTLVASLPYPDGALPQTVGREAYSYRYVYRAFAPLLSRWGLVVELTRPESRLDYALRQARRQGRDAVHLSFLPLHLAYLTGTAPNIAFPNWEFPHIPTTDLGGNPRNNWARIADHCTLLVTHCRATRDAFLRAGVRTPVRWVPVPVEADYFRLPFWQPDQAVELACPCYLFPQQEAPPGQRPETGADDGVRLSFRQRVRGLYRACVKPYLPAQVGRTVARAARLACVAPPRTEDPELPYRTNDRLRLSGVVYTTVLNPYDPRKNWQDLLTAYLLGLADRADVTLVVKLVLRPELLARGLGDVIGYYRGLGLPHRCKLAFVYSYLSDDALRELARASTYYVNTSRAEGSCLPLQSFLAAGRPGVAPLHSGLADYFDDPVGFVVDSQPEPAAFPHDPQKRLTTEWHRLVWTSLRDQFRSSYEVAREGGGQYRAMALRARECLAAYASLEIVRPRLDEALTEGCGADRFALTRSSRPVRNA